MLPTQILALALAFTPALVSAAIFPRDSKVKMLDPKGFRNAMKANQTSLVAFVAPWCGHCQRMVPEYSKAAKGLHPLIPLYAVDCDEEKNKRLCSEQGVKGFPTVKLFPRGKTLAPMVYESGERTAGAIFHWASRRVPLHVAKLNNLEDVPKWAEKTRNSGNHRALLLTKDKKIPLLWKVLANKYAGQITFSSHRDRKGKTSEALGYEAGGEKDAKVLVYPAGSAKPVRYQGPNKLDTLNNFFDSVLDGTADLTVITEEELLQDESQPSQNDVEDEHQQADEGENEDVNIIVPVDVDVDQQVPLHTTATAVPTKECISSPEAGGEGCDSGHDEL